MPSIKLVLLGDTSVGKSSFSTRYVNKKFNDGLSTTLGAFYFKKTIELEDKIYNLEIWDTAGQERYRSLAPIYFRNADIVLLFFTYQI